MEQRFLNAIFQLHNQEAKNPQEIQESKQLFKQILQKYQDHNFVDYHNPVNKIKVFQVIFDTRGTEDAFNKLSVVFDDGNTTHTMEYVDWNSGGTREFTRYSYKKDNSTSKEFYSGRIENPTAEEIRAVDAFIENIILPELSRMKSSQPTAKEEIENNLLNNEIISEGESHIKTLGQRFTMPPEDFPDQEERHKKNIYGLALTLSIQNSLANGAITAERLTSNPKILRAIKGFGLSYLEINEKIINLLNYYIYLTYSGDDVKALSTATWSLGMGEDCTALNYFENSNLQLPPNQSIAQLQALAGGTLKMIIEELEVIN